MKSFSKLPPVKNFQFALAGGLWIGINMSPCQKNKGLTLLSPFYTLNGENIFKLNLQARHTNAV